MQRATITQKTVISGKGLHHGREIVLEMNPSDQGICFVTDGIRIPAIPPNIVDTRLNTTIGAAGRTIATIEHLMAALYGLGITDCEIDVSGDEMPALDGSAQTFMRIIASAGLKPLPGLLDDIIITERLRIERNGGFVEIGPGPFAVEYLIDFPEPAIGRQTARFSGSAFENEIAPARTFGRLKDVEAMRAMGLSLGGGLHNAVVVDGDRILNPEGLRFPDEFVRHKILDLMGDLWTLGRRVQGNIKAGRANHMLHMELAGRIYEACR